MRPGDPATKISDGGDQRRPGLGRAVGVRAIVAARMEAQRVTVGHSHNAAAVQIGLHQGARDRPRHGVETPCGLRRTARRGKTILSWSELVWWQGEKRACLVQGVAQAIETAIEGDEVQKIAMLARGGIGLMCN